MAYLNANDFGVVSGRFALPSFGRGVAELRLSANERDGPPQATEAVTLEFQDGTAYAMTCIEAGPERGTWRLRLVQGAGAMSVRLPEKFYQQTTLRTVVKDLCSASGEAEGTLELDAQLPYWVRQAGSVQEALEAVLLHVPGHTYYFDAEGRLNVVAPAPAAFTGRLVQVAENPALKMKSYEGIPSLTPQHTLGGRTIARVEHRVGGGPRTDVYFD